MRDAALSDSVKSVNPWQSVIQTLPPGYKQTEVGMIPEDWEVRPLGDLAFVTAGGTPSRAIAQYWNGDIPWITTSEIDFRTIDHAKQFITKEGVTNSAAKLLPPGTLLMALYGQGKTRGKVGVLGIEAASNQACAAISLHQDVSRDFIFHFLSSQYEAIRRLSNTGNQENLNSSLVRSIPILLPTLAEQQAIAEALSDVDALIDALERLISKKRAIKQGAMQALLTGRRRLSGFDGEWEVTRFGDITQLRLDRVDPRRSGEVDFCVELENIEQGTGRLLSYADTDTGLSLKSVFQRDDVLFGKLRAYLRKFWLADRDGVCSTEIWVFKALRSRIIPTFLFQLVTMDEFIEVASTAYGTHMPRSDWKIVQNHEVRLPSLAEQTAIAAILSDMDAEIAALERRRDKTKLLKQGMMQELLTGRIRLV